MKVAMIGQKGIPSRAGGIEIHVEEVAKRLVKEGVEVVAYCRNGYCDVQDQREYRGVHLKFTPFIMSKHLDAITHTFTSTIHALASGCDIFHYHALGPSTLAWIPRIFGKKVVCTVHGLDWQRGKWKGFSTKFLQFGEYATAKFPHKTINVSYNLVSYYKQKYNLDTAFIPNGVTAPEKLEPDIITKKYGLYREDYILFLARLVPEKGAHYLIEAFKKMKTGKKLVIAGGASHSGEYEKKLHASVGENRNIIFTGFVTGKELAELYSNACLYVLPSDIEGLPISLLEAMSYGRCCLTSDIPENETVIQPCGFTFQAGNSEDLRHKLEELLLDSRLIQRTGKQAEEHVLEKYDWNLVAEQTYAAYGHLKKGKGRKKAFASSNVTDRI